MLEYRTSERDLVAATHVSRYWRSSLIHSPLLWNCFKTIVENPDVDRTLTYLERSKSAPIDIMVSSGSPQALEVFNYLAPHIARTRTLLIRGPQGADLRAIFLLLCTPSPVLQSLEIGTNVGLARLPDDFLGRQMSSIRSITFDDVHSTLESFSPLPNLTRFSLFLSEGADPFRLDALFRSLSSCPLLRKIYIRCTVPSRDATLDQIISLESLEELEYTCSPIDQILPHLMLPRLERLLVSSSLGQAQKLVDFLPHDGHVLLAGTTELLYYFHGIEQGIKFYGKGTDASFTEFRTTTSWFPSDTCIPFGQIEGLTVRVTAAVDFPINVTIFENLRVLRITPQNVQFIEGFFGSLHPYPEVGVPCRFLQEIEYPYWGPPGPLVDLVRERKRAGHQLELVRLLVDMWYNPDQGLVEELEEHVGEVRIVEGDGMV